MRQLILALALGTVVLVGLGTYVLVQNSRQARPAGPRPDPGLREPPAVAVLAGARDGIEILVKVRFGVSGQAAFTDDSLAAALGGSREAYGFLLVAIVNGSDAAVTIDPGALVLRRRDGSQVPVTDLRSLARDPGAAAPVLAILAPRPEQPLDARHLRVTLVAVPRGTEIEDLASGRFLDATLTPGRAVSARLEEYLESARPGTPMLAAVLEGPPEDPMTVVQPLESAEGQGR